MSPPPPKKKKKASEKAPCVGLNGHSPTNTQSLFVCGLQLPFWDVQQEKKKRHRSH